MIVFHGVDMDGWFSAALLRMFGGSGGGHKNASGATGQLLPFINYFYKS